MKLNQALASASGLIFLATVVGCQASVSMGTREPESAPQPAAQPQATPPVQAQAAPATTPENTTPPASAVATPAAPAPDPATVPSKVTMAGPKVQMPGNLVFETGKATLQANAGNEALLDELKRFLDQNPKLTILRIEGHTDNVGKPEENLELSGQRALTVKNWLIGKGIGKDRLIAVGFGDQKPVADNSTDAGRAQNRRTELKIAGWEGKNYLGRDPKGGGKAFE